MNQFLSLILIRTLLSVGGLAWATGTGRNRTGRDVTCRDHKEYLHEGICCLYCPAGSYVKEACRTASHRGVCETCDLGLYTEHENGLQKCLQCSTCRSDQEIVEQCVSSRDTRCQCKKGFYCLPDQVCEVCKTCRRCRDDEEEVESCTPHSNAVCGKLNSPDASTASAVSAVVIALVIVLLVIVLYWNASTCSKRAVASCCPGAVLIKESKHDSAEARQNYPGLAQVDSVPIHPLIPSPSQLVRAVSHELVEGVENEDAGLFQSLHKTATSSQKSLYVCIQLDEPCPIHSLSRSPPAPVTVRRLVPLNGDESLKKSFHLFEEMDFSFHNRFFRHLGLGDNAIKSAESLSAEDRLYELLKVWLEKEGMKADFNTLIQALLGLNQRLSAENIIMRAISNGYYKYEGE